MEQVVEIRNKKYFYGIHASNKHKKRKNWEANYFLPLASSTYLYYLPGPFSLSFFFMCIYTYEYIFLFEFKQYILFLISQTYLNSGTWLTYWPHWASLLALFYCLEACLLLLLHVVVAKQAYLVLLLSKCASLIYH